MNGHSSSFDESDRSAGRIGKGISMTVKEAIEQRHAVRRYTDRKLGADVLAALNAEIAECNAESDLNLQLVTDEPEAFGGLLAHYGRFSTVRNSAP